MSNRKSPAFPVVISNPDASVDWGISKRDYIAVKAMEALIGKTTVYNPQDLAERAYEYADAMETIGKK